MNEALRKKIEQRAYQLFVKRGGAHGSPQEDWARAEKEILAEEMGKKNPSDKGISAPVFKPAQAKKKQQTQGKR